MEPGIYGTDGTDPEEASGLLEAEDTLDGARGVRDVLDTGWSPPERPWAVDDWGTTEAEELAGEGLDGRLAGERPGRGSPAGWRGSCPTARTTRATASGTAPTPTANWSTTRWATSGPAG